MSSRPDPAHPVATALRHRATELRQFATAIEHAQVFSLDHPGTPDESRRMALCRRLLARNLHQLLAAADDLRDAAWRFDTRAAHLDSRLRAGRVA
jgi:hypothetical protein